MPSMNIRINEANDDLLTLYTPLFFYLFNIRTVYNYDKIVVCSQRETTVILWQSLFT